MSNEKIRQSAKAGLPPGTLIHIGSRKSDKSRITYMEYTSDELVEQECGSIIEAKETKLKNSVKWINIDGIHDTEVISQLGEQFGFHPLMLEDLLNTKHRPKSEEFENCLFLALKMLGISPKKHVVSEHISLILGEGYVISVQERQGDIFDALRLRLRDNKGFARKKKADYLFYRLLDTIVDHYFLVVEHISDETDDLEKRALQEPDKDTLSEIQHRKKQITFLRKNISSLREAVITFPTDNNKFIHKETNRYFHDVYEHIIQVYDSIDSFREILAGVMELYLSGVSNKMNKVMQFLTIISTIFIPLTFVAGIYGMNFDHMPELHWQYGYAIAWGVMVVILILMLIYFKRKNWL